VNKHSFKEVFELQAQTKLGFAQVFHLKLRLEVSHCFLNVPSRPDDIQIINIDGDDAESIAGFLYENAGTIIIFYVTFLQEKVTQPVEPHSSELFQPIQRPLQADAEHVAVLIRSRDLESFRDSYGSLNQVTHTNMRSQHPSTAFSNSS
jgi:hypothetical protein